MILKKSELAFDQPCGFELNAKSAGYGEWAMDTAIVEHEADPSAPGLRLTLRADKSVEVKLVMTPAVAGILSEVLAFHAKQAKESAVTK